MKKEQVLARINPLFLQGICHRGLHNEKYTENGLLAFRNALDHHMAIELDIHLTRDNELVVIHDSDTRRVTGKDGIIEDMTVKEIKENYRLLDGEVIPTFQEVLDLVSEQIPIVVELKVFRANYRPLAVKAKEILKQIRDRKNILLISFDPRSLFPLKKEGFVRQLLVAHDGKHEYTYFFRRFFEGVDLDQRFLKEKKYQRYVRKHFVNAWTIESEEEFASVFPYVDTVTFQRMAPETVRDRLAEKNSPSR